MTRRRIFVYVGITYTLSRHLQLNDYLVDYVELPVGLFISIHASHLNNNKPTDISSLFVANVDALLPFQHINNRLYTGTVLYNSMT